MKPDSVGKKIIGFFILCMAVPWVYAADGNYTETIMSPEMTVKIYFDAYVAQDWEVCTECLHPDLLQNLKNNIIDMLEEVSEKTRRNLLLQYHVQAIIELEQMPARQLYILYLQNRWEGLDAQSSLGIGSEEISFIQTKKINNEECQVEFKSSVNQDNQTLSKIEAYHLKKYLGKWKIYNTEGLKNLNEDKAAAEKIL